MGPNGKGIKRADEQTQEGKEYRRNATYDSWMRTAGRALPPTPGDNQRFPSHRDDQSSHPSPAPAATSIRAGSAWRDNNTILGRAHTGRLTIREFRSAARRSLRETDTRCLLLFHRANSSVLLRLHSLRIFRRRKYKKNMNSYSFTIFFLYLLM